MNNYFSSSLMMSIFSRPKRPYKGQVSDLLAFAQNFFENSLRSIQKLLEFEKKVFKKDYPRLAAFKTTFSLGINFLCRYPSESNQIQTMWLFWQNINFLSKILASKGQEGLERPYNSFRRNSREQNIIAKSFIFENIQLLFM